MALRQVTTIRMRRWVFSLALIAGWTGTRPLVEWLLRRAVVVDVRWERVAP